MDSSDLDRDILIQRYSADLIADLDRSLGPFLRKPNGQLRRRVRERETSRLVSQVLEPFQELPQLLDPHLPRYLPVLAEAYLEHLKDRRNIKSLSLRSQLLTPLSNAICRIIYAFCKIRGEKVVVRFLNVETRYLELLLHTIEDAERNSGPEAETPSAIPWTWHERYVILLWLSQLFFAPFDLSTISSGDVDDADHSEITGFQWPSQIPGITSRVIPLGIKHLASPGKERDGAKSLLVRVAMRKDMQEIGILNALVQWALSTIRPGKNSNAESPYYYIGSLAFLARVLGASADTSIMDQYLNTIYYATQAISTEDNSVFKVINGSALARKTMIKVIRSVITLVLRKPQQAMEDMEMVENSIGYLLESLADNDTPVRFAASKALSIITLKLEPDMALQVVEAVLESLNRNVLWVKSQSATGMRKRDLTSVDPLEWHGLMLTLSHLLYRRSPPPESLSDIIHTLLMGLSFEKRGPSGASIGTNVRDAACFGIWAVARRYSTAELLKVPIKSAPTADSNSLPSSMLQVIATELVVAGSLDPAGNIRRGSSAALQELIGRHPNTIEKGIAVVQTVDYHAVALRSRAIHEVALQATRLSTKYGLALLEALLGWRGLGDMDAGARRVAASAFGALTAEIARILPLVALDRFSNSVSLLLDRILSLQARQVEERHGLVLSLAAVFDMVPALLKGKPLAYDSSAFPSLRMVEVLKEILQSCSFTAFRKPELVAEAANRLIVSSYPVLFVFFVGPKRALSTVDEYLEPASRIIDDDNRKLVGSMNVIDSAANDGSSELDGLRTIMQEMVSIGLNRNETEVVEASSQSALVLLLFTKPKERTAIIQDWIGRISHPTAPRNKHGHGYFHALAAAYPLATCLSDDLSCVQKTTKALLDRWTSDSDIETRMAILQSLTGRDILRNGALAFLPFIVEGLDDYTTNARGDIGSHVRLEAIKATKTLWGHLVKDGAKKDIASCIPILVPRILRLAAEKLDRVRIEARSAISVLLHSEHAETFAALSFSSKEYFIYLLDLCRTERFQQIASSTETVSETECLSTLLAGLATSADTGNEDLVIASRAAVAESSRRSLDDLSKIGSALIRNLKLYQGHDRVIVPTLELVAYLFHVNMLQRCHDLNLRQLCLLTQKACYKTGNVRKIEACIKVYGAVASVGTVEDPVGETTLELQTKREEGVSEAKRRLGALMMHPWSRVRTLVVDELWDLLLTEKSGDDDDDNGAMMLMSVNWGRAEKFLIKKTVGELGLS